jgi:WD40 repeat protein
VKCVEFMPDDSYLVTVEEYDCTIMIWAYKEPEFGVLSQDDTSPISIPVR